MRKRFSVFATALFALSIVAGGCAKEKPPPRPPPARKAIPGTEKNAAPKPHVKLFAGTIEALDAATGTLTLKGPKGEMRFHVHENAKGQLDGLKIGEKVIVKHVDEIGLSIVKPRTGRDVLDKKEKEDAVSKMGPVSQAGEKRRFPQSSFDGCTSSGEMAISGA